MAAPEPPNPETLAQRLRAWGAEEGFADVGIATLDLDEDLAHLQRWLDAGRHGSMAYMAREKAKRAAPGRLRPGTLTVISARIDCRPPAANAEEILADGTRAYIARYALGRDYHRQLRKRLKRLAERLRREIGPFGYRVLTDSAPVLEKALARNARLGAIGKNTLLLNREAGSFFLLGEIFCDLPLAPAAAPPVRDPCGHCNACIEACPTGAITGPYQLDARRCISYLTIEHRGAIPVELRGAIGNRIFGCDDCQLACPWNKYAQPTPDADFLPRHGFDQAKLVTLFGWDEAQWLARTEGMALRRTGYAGWLRNLAVALGNAPQGAEVVAALNARAADPDPLVREHVEWALAQHAIRSGSESLVIE